MTAVAGVDWASDKHDTMVQDADGAGSWEGTVAHDEGARTSRPAQLRTCAMVGSSPRDGQHPHSDSSLTACCAVGENATSAAIWCSEKPSTPEPSLTNR